MVEDLRLFPYFSIFALDIASVNKVAFGKPIWAAFARSCWYQSVCETLLKYS